jgi:hypothetical protein
MRVPNKSRSDTAKPTILPIVTCMGRLEHLKQTLPRVVREFGRAVVVDWSCPQKSGAWARRNFGAAVDVVEVPGQRYFHKTRALNLGARRAAMLGASRLLFLDADTLVETGLCAACEQSLVPGEFGMADRHGTRRRPSLTGVLLVSVTDFRRIGGYDEEFVNYGCEDLDMRCRLAILGKVRPVDLPPLLVYAISHDDSLRVQHYALTERGASERRNWQMLRSRVRQWTGKEIESLPEIVFILSEAGPRTSSLPVPALRRGPPDVGARLGRVRWGTPLKG